ncbi:MAG: cyclase family protein [Actinomycetota bacterium]|nr:cyclase family protein [Actinomycetota bacterium]
MPEEDVRATGALLAQGIIEKLSAAGRIFDLSHELTREMPVHPSHPSFTFTLLTRHGDWHREHGYSIANELIVMSGHHGTHIDALGHVSLEGKLHGDVDAFEAQRGTEGLQAKDAAALPPILTRGVLVDVAGSRGVPELEPGEEVTLNELEAILQQANITIQTGDAVLFRTGWSGRWGSPTMFYPQDGAQPGPAEPVAKWLLDKRIAVTGSDTMVFECVRPRQNSMPVHGTLLVHGGIPIIEMLDLDELARSQVHEFLLICLPLRIRGATGSPIRPIALA